MAERSGSYPYGLNGLISEPCASFPRFSLGMEMVARSGSCLTNRCPWCEAGSMKSSPVGAVTGLNVGSMSVRGL